MIVPTWPAAFKRAALLLVLVGAVGCKGGDGHGDGVDDTSTGGAGEDQAHGVPSEAADEDDFEFEVDDPGATPEEVVDTEKVLLTKLEDRRDELDERELALAKQSKDLDLLEKEIESRLGNISVLERRLQKQLGIGKVAHDRREERISAISDLVATMSPQDGADLVAGLSDADAQWILMAIARKNSRKAAKLWGALPSERAAQLGQLYLDSDPQSVPDGDRLGPLDDATAPPAGSDGSGAPPPAPAVDETPSKTPDANATPPAGVDAAADEPKEAQP